PAGRYDGCFLARSSHFTGDIHAHELAWANDELWVVNTLFSCLCTLNEAHSFVPRWRPPFVTALAPEDRCHLNGLALSDGRPEYVTAFAETDTAAGWRPSKLTSGCLIHVPTGATLAAPRWRAASPCPIRRAATRGGSGCSTPGQGGWWPWTLRPPGWKRWPNSRAIRGAWPFTTALPSSACRRSARPLSLAGCRSPNG